MIMLIQLLLLSLSLVSLEAQHMGHHHNHADTKPETDLRPNTFFHHPEYPSLPDYDDYEYPYTEYEQPEIVETTYFETETTTALWNEVESTPWVDPEEFTTRDEDVTRTITCNEDEWMCLDGQFCLPESSRCNSEIECFDLSDEDQCGVTCNEDEWMCLDGQFCLPESSRCNSEIECFDLSDEDQCGGSKRTFMPRSAGSTSHLCSSIWIFAAILSFIFLKRTYI